METSSGGAEGRSKGLFLVFYLDEQPYGIPVKSSREIIPLVEITPVPKAPKIIEGIINLRGAIIPVVDLRRKLKLKERAPDLHTCLIIAELPECLFGFMADKVTDCLEIESISHPEESGLEIPAEKKLVSGAGQHQGKIILLFEPVNLLSKAERKALKAI
jgi:purine-binding chemotaxis protein CheW